MALSTGAIARLLHGLGSKLYGNEVATAIDAHTAIQNQTGLTVAYAVIATNVSTTINFGPLAVGDQVLILPAVAGNAQFVTVATAGTLPQAAVVGSLYVALRTYTAPAPDNQPL